MILHKNTILFFCLTGCMITVLLFLLASEKRQNEMINTLHAEIQDKIKQKRAMIKETLFKDLLTQTLVELQEEVEEKIMASYQETLREKVKDRLEKEMVYILYRDLKWKVARDIKKFLKDDITLFVKNNPQYVLKKKPPKPYKFFNEGKSKDPVFVYPPEPDVIPSDVNNICQGNKIKHHRNVLSFCVYGKRQIYYDGIEVVMKNARNITLYKDWQIRIYHDEAVSDAKIKEFLKQDDNIMFCDARKLPRYGNVQNILGKFWRVAPISDPSVDVTCSRDLDSKIITREEDAVKEWLSSGMVLHTMRDHRQHEVGMMAGMWCWNNRINRTLGRFYFERLIEKAKTYKRRTDQPLLNKVIWDHISKDHLYDMVLQHDSYNCKFYKNSKPFPTKRVKDNEFIGCPVHECDQVLKPCPEMCRPSYGKFWKYC